MIRRPVSDRPSRRFHGSWRASSLIGLLTSLAVAGTALAGWAGFGAGSGFASVSTLGATTVTATPTAGGANLSWTAVTAPGGSQPVTYFVQRDGLDAAGTCPTSSAPTAVTSCADSGIGRGTYSYTVTAVFHSWTAPSAPASVTVPSGALSQFHVTVPSSNMTAGVAANVTVTAWDAGGLVVDLYTGGHCLTFSGPGNSPNGTPPSYPATGACSPGDSYVTFTNGVATVPITLYAAGSPTLHVTDPFGHTNGAGLHLDVQGGTAKTFALPNPGTQTAGVQFSVSITSKDAWGNNASAYTGTFCLAFTGPGNSPSGKAPTYPAQGSCATGKSAVVFASGAASVPVTLFNPAATVLTATDSTAGATGSTPSFSVLPGGAASFAIANPGTRAAGTPFSVTISAMDGYGSVATAYTGTKCLTFSGPGSSPSGAAPVYPAPGGCAAGQSAVTFTNGVGSAQVTLFRAGSTSLTAAAGALTGTSPSFAVTGAATIAALQLTSGTNSLIAGTQANLTITGTDTYGNTSSYSGNLNMTFTGASTVPGSPYAPTVSDASGTAVAFGTPTAISFTNGVATVVQTNHNGAALLYASGDNTFRVSDGTHTSGTVTITVTVHAKQVIAGGYHSCALLTYGGVECWGRNNNGQVGDGGTSARELSPRAVQGLRDVVSLAAGQLHTCALLSDQTLWCWGDNSNGQLGDGTTTDRAAPVQVAAFTDVTSVATGRLHTCAVRSDNSVWCWGDNSAGQLGINTVVDQHAPVRVHGVGNVGNLSATSVSAGGYHTCAVSGGAVDCWGSNSDGQLGDGTGVDKRFPVAAVGISTATQVSAGGYHTCAVLSGGSLDCWGYNDDGELGIGSIVGQDAPVPVGLTGVTVVVAGAYHTCALTGTSPYCWGYNASGQVGNNGTALMTTPTPLSGLASASQIGAGGGLGDGLEHSIALAGGIVWTWGENTYGELGNGTRTDRHYPIAIALQ